MKHETFRTFLTAAILAAMTALGAVGCLVTGFLLPVEAPARLALTVAAVGTVCAALFLQRHGTLAVLCAAALAGGYLWHRGTVWAQTKTLIDLISRVYDSAYGWGVTDLSGQAGAFADGPLMVLGCLTAMGTCRAVCCRKSSAWGLVPGGGMLALCLVVTDTVPETLPLFAFLAGTILLLLTGGVRKESAGQGSRLAVRAVVPVCLFLLALFLAVPRTGYVNRSQGLRDRIAGTLSELPEQMLENMEKRAPAVRPVSTERVNLQALGPQSSQKQPVMYVFAQYEENLYLRGRDYDRYTGTGWESTPDRQESYGGAGGMVELVRLRALTGSFQELFLPCYPGATVTLIGGKVENGDQLGMYEMIRCASALAADSPDSRYLELPEETAARAGRILVENDLLEGDPWAIADFVRGSASYDRGTEAMPKNETDFALWFLESADTGYCVHFATGAVVLLRAAGIPARYVTGYLAWTKAEGWATVTADRAHAWAEFYDGERWQILDATPAAAEETEETEPAASEDKTQPTNGPEPEETTQAPTALEPDKTGQEKKPDLTWLVTMGKTMLWAALAAGLVTLQRLTRRFLRRKKAGQGDGSRRGLALWQEAERMAKLLGEKPPEELLAAAQKASFSQHTLTPEELVPFENYLRQCRRKLSQAPWYRRLVYKWIYAVI